MRTQFFRMQSPEREKRWQPQIAAERAWMSFAYLQLYTGDYLRDTRHLTPLKHGVYLLALMHCWDSKGPMPLDEQEAAGICNCRSSDEIESLRYVLSRFFVCMEDGYYNERMQHEVEKCAVISGARSAAGRKGFQARAKQMPGKSQASAKQQHLSPSPSPSLSLALSPPPQDQPAVAGSRSSVDDQPAQAGEKVKGLPDCPHLDALALWRECLPALPQHLPEQWRGARADHLRARWRETAEQKGWTEREQGLAYLRKLFGYVGRSEFLTGKAQSTTPGKRPFVVELEWLVNPTNWAKVLEGKYHEEQAA